MNDRRAEYNLLFCYMFRNVEVMEHALAARLTAEDFNTVQLYPYMLLFYGLEYFYNKYQRLPTEAEFMPLLANTIKRLPIFTDAMIKQALNLLGQAYAMDPDKIDPSVVLDPNGMLQRMVDDLKLTPLELALARERDHAKRLELRNQLEELFNSTRVAVDQHVDVFAPENVQYMMDGQQVVPSGIDFIDLAIGGLTRPSAVGLIAEPGGGKTMFGVQMLLEYVNHGNNSICFFYEQELRGDIAKRMYSYGAGLSRKELSCSYRDLSDSAKQAIQATHQRISHRYRAYDMSGTVRGQGLGGVKELDAIIGGMVRSNSFIPSLVVVDWLGPMVDRYYSVNPTRMSKKEQLDNALLGLVDLSRKYFMTVLVLHQIAPHIMEGKTPLFKPEWTSAHECKSFSLLLDYVFTFGRKCNETGCMWFNVSKARGHPRACRVVRMEGEYNKIVDANDHWSALPERVGDQFFTRKSSSRSGSHEGSSNGLATW